MFNHPAKWIVVFGIIIFAVVADQWTKFWAESQFASPRYPDHQIIMTVPEDFTTGYLTQALEQLLPQMAKQDRERLALAYTTRDNIPLNPQSLVQAGDKLELAYVSRNVIDGFWDYQYARNPGAAWSFLADANPRFRTWFFGITGVLALILLGGFIVFYSWKEHKRIVIVLSIILGGAIGNIIDRFRFGYVIDFISWHVGDKYWPTFNIADAFVTCGIALMIIDLLLSAYQERKEKPKTLTQNN